MRIERMKRLGAAALLALLGLTGCSDPPFALTEATLADHRARWLAAGIRDYRYAYTASCECPPALIRPTLIEVRDGRVAGVVYAESGEPVELSVRELFPTIEDLFDIIDEAIRRDAASLVVSYDEALGYPTNISIDYDVQVVDDEITMGASDLSPL